MTVTITKSNFKKEITESDKPVLVDFWAPWCGPCKMLGPIIEEVSGQVEKTKIAKINIDEEPELAQKYGVMSIPTLVYFKNGEPAQTVVGLQPKQKILALIGE